MLHSIFRLYVILVYRIFASLFRRNRYNFFKNCSKLLAFAHTIWMNKIEMLQILQTISTIFELSFKVYIILKVLFNKICNYHN